MINTISLTYRLSTSAADLLGDDALGTYEVALSAALERAYPDADVVVDVRLSRCDESTYRATCTTVDGVEESRELVSEGVTTPPVNKILVQGTKERPKPQPKVETQQRSSSSSSSSSGGSPAPAGASVPAWNVKSPSVRRSSSNMQSTGSVDAPASAATTRPPSSHTWPEP